MEQCTRVTLNTPSSTRKPSSQTLTDLPPTLRVLVTVAVSLLRLHAGPRPKVSGLESEDIQTSQAISSTVAAPCRYAIHLCLAIHVAFKSIEAGGTADATTSGSLDTSGAILRSW